MSLTNPNDPYLLKISWEDNGAKQQILDTKLASALLWELENRKGIKAKFEFIG